MTAKFYFNNGTYVPASQDSMHTLPIGAYTLMYNQNVGYFLSPTQIPQNPQKIYGNETPKRADRFLKSFLSKPNNQMGALLVGDPGSGKTMLTRKICNDAIANNVHVIIIDNGNLLGPNIVDFIHQSLKDISAVVLMDEFEKLVDMDEDEAVYPLLSLFDGSKKSHKFFLCTANNKYKISEPFFNRPSRFRYIAEYSHIPEDVINDYASSNINDPSLISTAIEALTNIDSLNFDSMVSLVDEINICGSITEAMIDFNITNLLSRNHNYECVSVRNIQTGAEYKIYNRNVKPWYDESSILLISKDNLDATSSMTKDKLEHFSITWDSTQPPVVKNKQLFWVGSIDSLDIPIEIAFVRKQASPF